jgi:hypothetical protein
LGLFRSCVGRRRLLAPTLPKAAVAIQTLTFADSCKLQVGRPAKLSTTYFLRMISNLSARKYTSNLTPR